MIPFREYLERIRPAVNCRIEEAANGGGAIDPGVLPLLIGGKRMRAGLLLRIHAGLARTTVPTRQALDLACAVELAHAASLILDDMLDGDTVRRGAPSLHLTRGEGRAVLDAVGILALPYVLAAPYGAGYVTMLASAQQSMARGVAWEMLGGPELPAAELYDAIIARKTGCLFSLAAAWGAMAAGEEETVVAAFAGFGLSAGKAMQIADDIADLHAPAGESQSRPGSEALLLRCVSGSNGTRQALGRILERETDGAAARIADAGRQREPPEAWEPFGQVVRDIVGLTIAREMPGDATGFRVVCPGGLPQR
ncbi:polyprenyl synthetase family protein [Methanoculleus oceani]|uniref:Polyprenyl synthetase n=1 Tax=Methanoculleus oceani TaxID=2184756 RepID=A0ABD4T9I5_9EURY|nr:polyprenyl synthetase family protein [Methanoculleus sp. CWC-02]MCM2464801.1 polyprenyl synthetase [Methanoculleus sp. CWC-02]